MKIPVKTAKEVEIMAKGGRKLARVLNKALLNVRSGVKLVELDRLIEKLIEKEKGEPSFKTVPSYHWASCINVNEGVVHGVPSDYQIKAGDLVSLDAGIFYRGFHTDMARTVLVKSSEFRVQSSEKELFLKAGRLVLKKAIGATRAGSRVGHISQAIEAELKRQGFSPVKSLTGHGVGKKLHEPPVIPCFLKGKVEKTPLLAVGMTLAIEVIYTQRKVDLYVDKDGWTVKTKNKSWAGLFEDTVLITAGKTKVLTKTSKAICA